MHPFFFASGPAFIPGCKLDPFNNTDLFPLFCKILDLKCPVVNGTLSHVTKCLRTQSTVKPFPSGIISEYTYIFVYIYIILHMYMFFFSKFLVMFVLVTASILCVLTVLALLTWNVRYWRKRGSGFVNIEESENQYRL